MTATLILFGRWPGYGFGKRRLARRIGALAALRFQRRQLAELARRLGNDRRWQTVWCLTPDHSLSRLRLTAGQGQEWGQGRGDLGQRMRRALRQAGRDGPVVLIGTDIPGVTPTHIATALRALDHADLVFGPAEDGGFWLVGWSGRRPLPPGFFQGVRWSTASALADSLHGLGRHRRVALTEILADCDT